MFTEHPELFEVRRSNIQGKGVFAREFIPKGTKLTWYKGEIITKAETERRGNANHSEEGDVYIFTLDDKFDIDATRLGNDARFFNHSCGPNCEATIYEDDDPYDIQIWIESIQDIQPGEELTYNYGYETDDYTQHPCICGKPGCKGFIGKKD